MKKFIAALSTALLVVILALTLSACDKSGAIENKFKDNGYNEIGRASCRERV